MKKNMNTLQNPIDSVLIGDTIMHWHENECLLSKVIAKGFSKGQHACIVVVGGVDIFVTDIV